MPKLHHFDDLGTARFVTFSTYGRRPVLSCDAACCILVVLLDERRTKMSLKLLGYVFMPDHVHLVIHPQEGMLLGKVIGQLKARSARRIGKLSELRAILARSADEESVRVWQRRCYDHNCRTPMSTREKIEYCHENPVTRGLVKEPGDWRWSSYNWYEGVGGVPLAIDSIDPA